MTDKFYTDKDLRGIWKAIANGSLEWGDVDDKFKGMQPGVSNIYCPFHDNRHSPSARPYWDEAKDILVIHCFRERRTFTVYDYIDLILCGQKRYYKDPGAFLVKHFGETKYNELFKLAQDNMYMVNETQAEIKQEYIKNLYNKYDNVVDFINALYLEEE